MNPSPRLSPLLSTATLLSALLLTGCGGGGNKSDKTEATPEPKPPPAVLPENNSVSLEFTKPTAANNVHTSGSAVDLELRVWVDGKPAPDNTYINLSAPSTTLSPVQAYTRAGSATSTLVGPSAGKIALQATVVGKTASASRNLYLRPAPTALQVLVPAYFTDGKDGSSWKDLAAGQTSFPDVKITAILNPSNGIFTKPDADLSKAASAFTTNGGKLLGYVAADYGNGARPLEDVKANIDAYVTHYGSLISGIFLDEVHTSANRIPFFQGVYQHLKDKHPTLSLTANPGTFPDPGYTKLADTLVTFEGTATAYRNFDPQPQNTWVYERANQAQAMLVHDASCVAMQTSLYAAHSARNNTGWVYATDGHFDNTTNTGNPWSKLPSYWIKLLGTVDAINRNWTPPTC